MSKNYQGMREQDATSPVDMYRETCKTIDSILNYKNAMNNEFGGSVSDIEVAFRTMRDHCDKSVQEIEITVQQREIDNINKVIYILRDKYIYQPITPLLNDITLHLMILMTNWNNNCFKNSELSKSIDFVSRLRTKHLTMMETIDVMKALNEKIKKTIEYIPPAFEQSKAYYNSLKSGEQDVKEES